MPISKKAKITMSQVKNLHVWVGRLGGLRVRPSGLQGEIGRSRELDIQSGHSHFPKI